MGPEEFLEGLGIGLRSFVGGTVGTFVILPVYLNTLGAGCVYIRTYE